MRLASWLLILCGFILIVDIGGELHGFLLSGPGYSTFEVIHLIGEAFATLGTGGAFLLTRAELRRSVSNHQVDRDRLKALRKDFDRLMWEHFARWELSRAECDVALLTVRGMKISQIARMRDTQEGTVKSQLSTIYRKSGLSTRSELLAHFMDEFLDHSSDDADVPATLPPVRSIPVGVSDPARHP